jgi:hypothetical protein
MSRHQPWLACVAQPMGRNPRGRFLIDAEWAAARFTILRTARTQLPTALAREQRIVGTGVADAGSSMAHNEALAGDGVLHTALLALEHVAENFCYRATVRSHFARKGDAQGRPGHRPPDVLTRITFVRCRYA